MSRSETVEFKNRFGALERKRPEGTIGWISQDRNHGVTARHVLYPRREVGFGARHEWAGRETTSFLMDDCLTQPCSAPADVEVDLAIVDMGGFPIEGDYRTASLLSRDTTVERLLEEACRASLIDIQGRVVPQELRTLDATTASKDTVELHNLLVDATLCVSGAEEKQLVSGWVLMRLLLQDRVQGSPDYEYSPHTAHGGAALCMTSSDDSRTVIGFLRGRLKQRPKFPEASDMGPDGNFTTWRPKHAAFCAFTLSNVDYLNYFNGDGRTGAVNRLIRPDKTCALL